MSERRERFLTWLLTLVALALLSPLRASGNTLTTGSKSFTYDSENHLTSMTASGTTVSIIYDAFGNRVSKKVNGVTTKYLVEDDMNPTGYPQVLDELTNGVVTRTYTYGLQRISQDQVIENLWTPSFYGYDGGGNVRQLTNSLGTVTDKYEYDAFGNDVYHTGTTPNNYLYRGEQFDSDLGLYYLRARYYNPSTGRFLSRDPEDGKIKISATLHKYLYASGDPVNRIDPTGRADFVEVENVDNVSITMGHGARHLVGTGLSQAEAEAAIEQVVREDIAADGGIDCKSIGMVVLSGIPIIYRVYLVDAACLIVNVGTYFPL